eukprot:Opistho-1_new@8741
MGCAGSRTAAVPPVPQSPPMPHIDPFKPGPNVAGEHTPPPRRPSLIPAETVTTADGEEFVPNMLRRRGSSFRLGKEKNPLETDEFGKIKEQERKEQEMLREERRLSTDPEQNMRRISMIARAMTADAAATAELDD